MMKNVLLLTAVFAFVLVSCKKEKTNSDENSQATIVGKWNYVKLDVERYMDEVKIRSTSETPSSGIYFKFEKDLTYSTNYDLRDYTSVYYGSYMVVGGNLIFNGDAEDFLKIKLLNKHTLVLEEIDVSSSSNMKDIWTYYFEK